MRELFFFEIFRFQRIHPNQRLSKFKLLWDLSITSCLQSLMIYNFYTHDNFDSLMSFLSVNLMVIKYVTLLVSKKDIIKLVKDIEGFWKIDVEDEELTFFMLYPLRLIRFYKIFLSIGCSIYVMRAFLLKKLTLFDCYKPPLIPGPLLFLAECYLLSIVATVYGAFNMLVCYLVSSATVQFRLLNLKIQAIDMEAVDENRQSLDKCVGDLKHRIIYHQRIIRYADDVNNTLSVPMGSFVAIGVTLICIDMYLLSLEETSFANIFRDFITIVAVTSEFFIAFGLPAQLMMDQAEDTANALYYDCKWFLPSMLPIRKYLLMMIMRSQKGVCITALNYHVINKETVVLMLKTAYSFFAFLQATVT